MRQTFTTNKLSINKLQIPLIKEGKLGAQATTWSKQFHSGMTPTAI